MDSMFLEGAISVPLSTLISDVDYSGLDSTESLHQLTESAHRITGLICTQTRDQILKAAEWTPEQFHKTIGFQNAELTKFEGLYVTYLGPPDHLQEAKKHLGSEHICSVNVYCIPRTFLS